MTLLEIDLGQSSGFNSDGSITKSIGLIINNNANSLLPTSIDMINKPMNYFYVKKTGNTKEYILILTFEEM